MFEQKLVMGTEPVGFSNEVNTLLAQGWSVVIHSLGGMFAPDRKVQWQLMLWIVLEKEVM